MSKLHRYNLNQDSTRSSDLHVHSRSSTTKIGYIMIFLGFLACPCHLPLTIPLILVIIGSGSLIAGILAPDFFLMIMLAFSIIFLGLLAMGYALITRGKLKDTLNCPSCQGLTQQN